MALPLNQIQVPQTNQMNNETQISRFKNIVARLKLDFDSVNPQETEFYLQFSKALGKVKYEKICAQVYSDIANKKQTKSLNSDENHLQNLSKFKDILKRMTLDFSSVSTQDTDFYIEFSRALGSERFDEICTLVNENIAQEKLFPGVDVHDVEDLDGIENAKESHGIENAKESHGIENSRYDGFFPRKLPKISSIFEVYFINN
jgi:hypothetical protein